MLQQQLATLPLLLLLLPAEPGSAQPQGLWFPRLLEQCNQMACWHKCF
jgi:hypothetical protein